MIARIDGGTEGAMTVVMHVNDFLRFSVDKCDQYNLTCDYFKLQRKISVNGSCS